MYSEDELMQLTPRKFKAQLDVHQYIQQLKYGANSSEYTEKVSKDSVGYIDKIPGW